MRQKLRRLDTPNRVRHQFAELVALLVGDGGAQILNLYQAFADEAPRLLEGLSDLGYGPVPTWTNFVYCEIGVEADAIAKRMQAEGVIIRPLGPWGAPTAIRGTIGTLEQNQTFLKAFRKVMENVRVREKLTLR